MKKVTLFSAISMLALAAAGVNAATDTHTLSISEIFTTAGAVSVNNPTAAQIQADENSGTTFIYRVTVNDQLGSLGNAPTTGDPQAFGIDDVNYAVSGGVSRVPTNVASARANWVANNPSTVFDDNGAAVATFATNADSGASSSDLQQVTQIVNTNSYNAVFDDANDDNQVADPRASFAVSAPGKLGTIDVEYNGSNGPGWLTLSGDQFALLDQGNGQFGVTQFTLDGVITQSGLTDPTLGSAAVLFNGVVPEPASLSLLGLGAMGLIARRRKA